jgi:hypothetical protein
MSPNDALIDMREVVIWETESGVPDIGTVQRLHERVRDYRDGGGGRSAGGVMSKRCLPVIGSIDRSCSVQKVISLAVCFGSRVYTRLRLSGARKISGATVMISNSRVFFSLSEMRSVIMTFFPIGTAP